MCCLFIENDSFCHKFRSELHSFLQKRTRKLMADRSHSRNILKLVNLHLNIRGSRKWRKICEKIEKLLQLTKSHPKQTWIYLSWYILAYINISSIRYIFNHLVHNARRKVNVLMMKEMNFFSLLFNSILKDITPLD